MRPACVRLAVAELARWLHCIVSLFGRRTLDFLRRRSGLQLLSLGYSYTVVCASLLAQCRVVRR